MAIYFAKSALVSKTLWFNIVALIVAAAQSKDILALLPPKYLGVTAAIITLGNMILRFNSVRPIAFLTPRDTVGVPVPNLYIDDRENTYNDPPPPPKEAA